MEVERFLQDANHSPDLVDDRKWGSEVVDKDENHRTELSLYQRTLYAVYKPGHGLGEAEVVEESH
jgi:hypothetical protein